MPRATLDVDLNVFVDGAELDRAIEVLVAEGLAVAPETARSAADADGWFSGKLDGVRVDVFVPSIPFSSEVARTRRQ